MKVNFWKKLLIILLLILNGNYPLITFGYSLNMGPSRIIWIFIVLYIVFIRLKKKIEFKPMLIFFLILFFGLTFIQNEVLNSFYLQEFLSLTFMFITLYLILFSIGFSGLLYLPKIMVNIIKFSLIFYIPFSILFILKIDLSSILTSFGFQADPSRLDSVIKYPLHLVFHNFSGLFDEGHGNNNLVPRNSSFFWEPGAFLGTIVMSFLIFILLKKYYSKSEFTSIFKWLIIGIISTFSTTGLLLLPLLILLMFLRNRNFSISTSLKVSFITLILALINLIGYYQIPTLNSKIADEFESVENNERGSETTRLGSLLMVSTLVLENPYLGVGFAASNKVFEKRLAFIGYEFTDIGIGNGMILMLAWAGIPYFVILLLLMGYNLRQFSMSSLMTFGIIIVLLILLQGESWMKLPLIYSFCFLSILKPKKHYDNKYYNSYI